MAKLHELLDGESIDEICFRHYGFTAGAVEAVLRANPDLLDNFDSLGRFAMGSGPTFLRLPELPPPQKVVKSARIFD